MNNIKTAKSVLRQEIKQILSQLQDRSEKSERIWEHLRTSQEFQTAVRLGKGIMFYADFGNEVQTIRFFPYYLEHYSSRSPLVVPYCEGGEIHLFRLESVEELVPQTLGISEPAPQLKSRPERSFPTSELGLILVPGVAFDLAGHRLGRGAGYYDRFLTRIKKRHEAGGMRHETFFTDDSNQLVKPDSLIFNGAEAPSSRLTPHASRLKILALAFDAQIVQTVPHEPHDFLMDALISESGIKRF